MMELLIGTKWKPGMEIFCIKTIGGIYGDALCSNCDVSCNTRYWPMIMSDLILNICGINSLIAYKEDNKCKILCRTFLRGLGVERIRDCSQQRKTKMCLPENQEKIVEPTGELRGE